MSASILREAAALMRSRAEAATFTPEPWDVDEVGTVWAQEADGQPVHISSRATDQDAEHIASWHPAVALAVADWLDADADQVERNHLALTYDGAPMFPPDQNALAVARAYLGSPA